MTNQVTKKQKIMVVTGEYQDKNTGQNKKRRRQVGEVTHWSDGGMSIEMWGPTGVQKLSVFDYSDDNQQQAPQQGFQQPQQPQQQAQGFQAPQGGYQPPQGNGYNQGSNGQ